MPSEPLFDFDALDLTRVRFDKDAIRRACKQRGRMEMLDGVLHFDLEAGLAIGFKDIRADDWWAADHIPGRPIFPGALQIEGAAQLCTFDFIQRRADLSERFVGFAGLNDTRFRSIVVPPGRLVFAARMHKARASMFTYRTQAFLERELVFETEILGVVL